MVGATALSVLLTVAAHAAVCRVRGELGTLARFIIVASAGMLLLIALATSLRATVEETLGALLIYAFACELYVFLFTLTLGSVSAQLLVLLAQSPRSPGALDAAYSGRDMTQLRIERMACNGLIVARDGLIELTGTGRRLVGAFASLRRFFGHHEARRPTVPWPVAWAKLISVLIFAGILLWPLAWIIVHGATLVGVNEESTGYRYFYSLRALYDPPTFMFLPQGQLTNLIQKAIQLALTLFGLPPTQLRPRIDYFCYASVAAFHLMNVAAFAWLASQLRTVTACVLSALFWALPFYLPGFSGPYTLLQPDYVAVDALFAILAAAAVLSCSRGGPISLAAAARLGVLLGLAAATKVTFILYPLVAFGYAMLRVKYSRLNFLLRTMIATTVAGAVWLGTCFADYELVPAFLASHVETLLAYIRYGGGIPPMHDLPPLAWLADRALNSQPWNAAVYLTPILALLAIPLCRTRDQFALAVTLCVVALGWSTFLYKRDYAPTLLEAAFGFHLLLYSAAAIIVWPNVSARWRIPVWMPGAALASILGVVIAQSANGQVASIVRSAASNTVEQARLAALQSTLTGRRLWVVLDNSQRPLSIESAIMKGSEPPGSLIMSAMFPDLDFRFMQGRPLRLADYSAVLFSFDGPIEQTVALISRTYSVPLDRWQCRPVAIVSSQAIGLCQPNS
jgi:hypothetical protein